MSPRSVQAITARTGPNALEMLPLLRQALTGDGPALLPIAENDPRTAALRRQLGAGSPLLPGEDDPGDPTALVIATSGSTGAPKGVLLSAGQLAASAAATEARLGGPGHWLLALSTASIAGMQVLLRAARAGSEPTVIDTGRPFTAARFAAAAQRLPGPRRYVSLVPTQLQRVLADPEATAIAAHIFDAILVGGANTPAPVLRAAHRAGLAVVTTYGMTETCGGCVYDGAPLPKVTARFDAAGALVLTGPMVARGYRHQPGHPAFANPASFVTSDTGTIAADGTVAVTGRLDDVIISGGINIAPGPIETALTALDGITDAVVVGVPDTQWGQAVTAVIVTRPGERYWDLAAVRDRLSGLPAAHRPQRIVTVTEIPQLPSGKPDRRIIRELATRR